jgi:hypothetical protein
MVEDKWFIVAKFPGHRKSSQIGGVSMDGTSMHHLRLAAVALIAALLIASSSGALAKNTGLIFVSFGSADHLAVIDPKTNTIVKHLKLARAPRDASMRISDSSFSLVILFASSSTLQFGMFSSSQNSSGRFEVPNWDQTSQKKVRDALLVLVPPVLDSKRVFGTKDQVDPVRHLIGTAAWLRRPS